MRKIVALVLVLALCLSLAGCVDFVGDLVSGTIKSAIRGVLEDSLIRNVMSVAGQYDEMMFADFSDAEFTIDSITRGEGNIFEVVGRLTLHSTKDNEEIVVNFAFSNMSIDENGKVSSEGNFRIWFD